MRKRDVALATTLLFLGACAPSVEKGARQATAPLRRDGLWRQTMMRDGRTVGLGSMKVCINAQVAPKWSILGDKITEGRCTKSVTRQADGGYEINAQCLVGENGHMTSHALARGDFSSHYSVRIDSDIHDSGISGLDGRHITEVQGDFLGACPSGMAPGDVVLANGMKTNLERIRQLAALIGLTG
jgi:hypothetical protein